MNPDQAWYDESVDATEDDNILELNGRRYRFVDGVWIEIGGAIPQDGSGSEERNYQREHRERSWRGRNDRPENPRSHQLSARSSGNVRSRNWSASGLNSKSNSATMGGLSATRGLSATSMVVPRLIGIVAVIFLQRLFFDPVGNPFSMLIWVAVMFILYHCMMPGKPEKNKNGFLETKKSPLEKAKNYVKERVSALTVNLATKNFEKLDELHLKHFFALRKVLRWIQEVDLAQQGMVLAPDGKKLGVSGGTSNPNPKKPNTSCPFLRRLILGQTKRISNKDFWIGTLCGNVVDFSKQGQGGNVDTSNISLDSVLLETNTLRDSITDGWQVGKDAVGTMKREMILTEFGLFYTLRFTYHCRWLFKDIEILIHELETYLQCDKSASMVRLSGESNAESLDANIISNKNASPGKQNEAAKSMMKTDAAKPGQAESKTALEMNAEGFLAGLRGKNLNKSRAHLESAMRFLEEEERIEREQNELNSSQRSDSANGSRRRDSNSTSDGEKRNDLPLEGNPVSNDNEELNKRLQTFTVQSGTASDHSRDTSPESWTKNANDSLFSITGIQERRKRAREIMPELKTILHKRVENELNARNIDNLSNNPDDDEDDRLKNLEMRKKKSLADELEELAEGGKGELRVGKEEVKDAKVELHGPRVGLPPINAKQQGVFKALQLKMQTYRGDDCTWGDDDSPVDSKTSDVVEDGLVE